MIAADLAALANDLHIIQARAGALEQENERLRRSIENLTEPEPTDRINQLESIASIVGQLSDMWAIKWLTLPDGQQELIRAHDKMLGRKRDQKTGEIIAKGEEF